MDIREDVYRSGPSYGLKPMASSFRPQMCRDQAFRPKEGAIAINRASSEVVIGLATAKTSCLHSRALWHAASDSLAATKISSLGHCNQILDLKIIKDLYTSLGI